MQEHGVDVGLLLARSPLDAPLQQVEIVAADVDDEVGPDPLAHLRVHELEPLFGQGVLGAGDLPPLPGKMYEFDFRNLDLNQLDYAESAHLEVARKQA